MNVDRAESQLLELIRSGGRDFTLTVVNITDPNGSSHFSSGEGSNFAEAWHRQEVWWA